MANTATTKFQGSPCDPDWYEYFKNLTEHRDLECTVHFCTPKTYTRSGKSFIGMFPSAIATNLQCKNQTTYKSTGGVFANYALPVHQLVSMNATDEIDPRMLENKIPSASFSFKVQGVNKQTPLADLDAILANFEGKMIRVYRGFADHSAPIFDSEGRWALDYYDGFVHDTVCLGNYTILGSEYNFDRETIDVTCEHVFFHKFSQDDVYRAMAKDGSKTKTDVLYQRYPYPFRTVKVDGGDASHRIYRVSTYKLGYDPLEMLRSPTYETFGGTAIPLYGYTFPGTETRAYGVNTESFKNGVKTSSYSPTNWWHYAELDLEQSTDATAVPVARTLDDQYTLSILANTWKKENALTTLVSWNLMNSIHWVPARPFGKEREEAIPIGENMYLDGSWATVSGQSPDEDCFLDKKATTWSRSANGSNGKWFPSIPNKVYKVLPSFLLSQSVQKDKLDWTDVSWVKTYYMNITTPIMRNIQLDDFSFQNQSYFADTTDVYKFGGTAWQPYPSDQAAGFRVITTQPLKDDTWYLNKSGELNGSSGFMADLFGFNLPATNQMGGVNLPSRGDSVVAYRVLWNKNIPALVDKQPLVLRLIKQEPTVYSYDKNNNLVSDEVTQNTPGIDTIHAYGHYKNIAKRMIARANMGEVGTAPLYQIKWTMVDDPSLRVGTSVWVPLQNEYLKVYITKQERTFDGGARLTCTGWCYAKTGVKVRDPKIIGAKATVFVNNPDTDPKGEWVKIAWTATGDYAPIDPVTYVFNYTQEFGQWSKELGKATLLFGEPQEKMFNLPYLAEQTDIPLEELTGGRGYYSLTAYFPPNAHLVTADVRRVNVAWNNEEFSYLHAGYVRASNEHQPFVPGNLLQG